MTQVLSSNIGMSHEAYISGANRLNFIKKPLVATMNDVPLYLSPPVQQINQNNFQQIQQEQIIESKVKQVQIQTDYRDSETQTDPYSPQQIYREGERPQVLMLKNLTYGKGLPASIQQLDQIQLNRQKLWFQNCLPPISDEASFNLRRKLMQQQQLRQWSKKQEEIKKLHGQGLELVKKALVEREKDIQEKNSQRIQQIKIRKTQQKNRLIAKIQRKKIKILRKLLKARKNQDEDPNLREIIQQYANFASPVYAGITRQGLSLDKIANKYEVQPIALNNYQGLNQINVPSDEVKPIKTLPQYTRLEITHKKALEFAQLQIDKKLRPPQQQDQVVSNDIQALRNVIARPSTPTWKYDENFNLTSFDTDYLQIKAKYKANNTPNPADVLKKKLNKREAAVIFLQRILRGRAQQNFMYEGKQKRLALIEQLLIVAKIPNIPEDEAEQILLLQHQQKFKNALLEGLQGQAISQTLDGLSKQLLRVKQQAKIANLVKNAEKDRINREIQEAGKRNAEKIIRQRQQYLYNEIVRMNQGTVDTYLDWIINNTVDKASTRQASIMATLRKTEMNNPLEGFERRYNNNQTLIRDLVQSFLLPNIQRSKLMKKIQLEQRRFKEAAKKSIQTTLTKTSTKIMQQKK